MVGNVESLMVNYRTCAIASTGLLRHSQPFSIQSIITYFPITISNEGCNNKNNPISDKICSVIKFLNIKDLNAAKIQCELFKIYGPTVMTEVKVSIVFRQTLLNAKSMMKLSLHDLVFWQ